MWSQPVDKNKPKGKTRFFESVRDPVTGSYRTFSVTVDKYTTHTQKVALRALQQRREAFLQSALSQSEENLTIHDLIERFNDVRSKDPNIRASTQRQAMMKLRPVERLLGSDTKVSTLTAGYIRQALLNSGKSAVTLNGYLKILKALLRWGFKNDYVSDISYIKKIERWKEEMPYRERIQNHYLEKDELETLIAGMNEYQYKLIAKFLVLSGMRIGEMIALQRADVDIDNRVIHITKNMQGVTRIIDLPKNSTSYRDVYMQDELAEVCREIERYKRMMGIVSEIFFPDPKGDYLRHETVEKYFRENSERILKRRVTPHMLRHTHTSLMIEAAMTAGQNITLDDIAERLGHANSKITKDIYFHKTNLVRDATNRKLDLLKIL